MTLEEFERTVTAELVKRRDDWQEFAESITYMPRVPKVFEACIQLKQAGERVEVRHVGNGMIGDQTWFLQSEALGTTRAGTLAELMDSYERAVDEMQGEW